MSAVPGYIGGGSQSNPYGNYASAMNNFNGDQSAAIYGTGGAQQNLMSLGAQQQTLAGDGGSGYTMQGGNDTTGSSWGNSQTSSNPWTAMSPWQAPTGLLGATGSGVTSNAAQPAAPSQSSYPTYNNSYGIGVPPAGGAPTPVAGQMGPGGSSIAANAVPSNGAENANAVSSMAPQATTTGFNPWSLQGEANSRVI